MNQPPEECPACKTMSPCVDYDAVHNGVGYVYGNHIWDCPTHGDFAFGEHGPVFRDGCSIHEDCTAVGNGLLAITCAMTHMAPRDRVGPRPNLDDPCTTRAKAEL
jgi:hypothetical protein